MANNIGSGSGLGNPFLDASRMASAQNAPQYNPGGQLDAQAMAQQIMMQSMLMNSQQRNQAFNQENPRMALPQNIGATLGNYLSQKLSPAQTAQSQQVPQQDPDALTTAQVRSQINSALASNLKTDPDYGSAMYHSGMSVLKDPQWQGNTAAVGVARQYLQSAISDYKYNPKDAADADVKAATEKAVLEADQTKAAQDKLQSQWVVTDTTPGADGQPKFQKYGSIIPQYDSSGAVRQSFGADIDSAKQQAQQAGVNPANIAVSKYSDYQASLDKLTQQRNVAAAQQQARDDNADPLSNLNTAQRQALQDALATNQIQISDIGSGKAAAGRAELLANTLLQNEGFSTADAATQRKAMRDWAGNGVLNQNLIALDTALQHTATMKNLVTALNNPSNVQGINKASNAFKTEFGLSSGPTDVATALPIWAREVNKSIVPRGGTGEEVAELEKAANLKNATTQQATDALNTVEGLFLDRGVSMKNSYTHDTGKVDFNLKQGAGGNLDTNLREHEYNMYRGQTQVNTQEDYNKVPLGSPYTYKGKIMVKSHVGLNAPVTPNAAAQ